MKKVEMKTLVADKLAEVTLKIAAFQANEGNKWSENTCKTQIQQRKTIQGYLMIINELLDNIEATDVKMIPTVADKFKSVTTLTEERDNAPVSIKDGDLLVDVLKKYSNKKFEVIMKAAIKAGLNLKGNKFSK